MFISSIIDKILTYFYRKKTKVHHIYEYNRDAILIQAGHIPYMAFRLLEGSVLVFSRDTLIAEFGPHTTWGSNEIINEQASLYTVCIRKGSKVCAIGKSELQKSWMKILNFFERDMLTAPEIKSV